MAYLIDYKTYEILYAKYLQGDRTKQLVDLAGNMANKRVVDLCCGGFRLTKEVLQQNPSVVIAIDESKSMMNKDFIDLYLCGAYNNLAIYYWSVDTFLDPEFQNGYDVIFCQQAVNYWFNKERISKIYHYLNPGGLFIFNTFNKKPSTIPMPKSYEIAGRRYVEISWLDDKIVRHVQIAQGFEPHVTEFQWIPQEDFIQTLSDFKINILTDGATDLYRCEKGSASWKNPTVEINFANFSTQSMINIVPQKSSE